MECHAWMVTIPLGNRKHVASLGNRSVTKRMKDICVPYKNEYFLNPGHPGTKEYLMKLVREVVSRYDIDGVHFDYLRYPENAPLFPDKYDFRRYGKGRTLDQWRRDNISEIVRYIYKDVKSNEALGEVSAPVRLGNTGTLRVILPVGGTLSSLFIKTRKAGLAKVLWTRYIQ